MKLAGRRSAAATEETVGWLTFISGVVIGALIIVTAVVIAWRQRVIQLRDRAADRDREDARQQEREAHEGKVARREMWRAEYEAIWKLFECGEDRPAIALSGIRYGRGIAVSGRRMCRAPCELRLHVPHRSVT